MGRAAQKRGFACAVIITKGAKASPEAMKIEKTIIPRKNIFEEKIFAKRSRNGATLDFALAQSPESKVCGDEGAEGLGICSTSARKIIIKP